MSNDFAALVRAQLAALGEGLLRPRWSAGFVLRPRMRVANTAGGGDGRVVVTSLTAYIARQFDPTVRALELLTGELRSTLTLLGCASVGDLPGRCALAGAPAPRPVPTPAEGRS